MSEVHPPDPRSLESASGGKRFWATLAPGCPPPDRMDHRQEPQDRIHTSQPDLTSTHGHGHSHTAKARWPTAPGASPRPLSRLTVTVSWAGPPFLRNPSRAAHLSARAHRADPSDTHTSRSTPAGREGPC